MRTEEQVMELVLKVAEQDTRIRAVGLNGSRTNPNVPKDIFQDYDIAYLVTEIDSFINDPNWVDIFGERIIMQTPENMSMFPPELGERFSYLMLFTDGNRIDLTLIPIEEKDEYCKEDKLTIILMDKDNPLPEIPAPTDSDYWVRRPSADFFADCCNEFWWVSTYVAKGLWRKEILYAAEHLNNIIRPMLFKMLEWRVGIETDYSVSIGKSGKYLENYLSKQNWQKLLSTYPIGSYESIWKALFVMCDLFRSTAIFVAGNLDFNYPYEEDQKVNAYLKRVERLTPDGCEI
ncbi:aminoglycoside 6-adenylyltransferase [Psychrobacillus sp. OK032]|uniref:aminoglycoside 6-adenylyltransferase n=1 Tax=Psychrobacillus sp. OK032 TaxID=1884358 RepID=UPI0008C577DD|nr:aminoglycoside 6-adenylyltransferase [Psychrobacillus sp. OK032]SES12519.1 aminoglycoside 6-adenylyltransferase [Psychrobacillus sp. OK032]